MYANKYLIRYSIRSSTNSSRTSANVICAISIRGWAPVLRHPFAVHHLYGKRDDFISQMVRLVEVMASRYIERGADLKQTDICARTRPQLVPEP